MRMIDVSGIREISGSIFDEMKRQVPQVCGI
jgi:hypothetical protein